MTSASRLGLAACLSIAAVWAGAQVYLSRGATHTDRGIPAPAGEASMPIAADQNSPFDAAPPAKIPDRLPEMTLANLEGKPTSISHWQGKSLMINFWATWCPPCRREIPLLQALHDEKAAENIEIVGIAVDYVDKVRAFRDQFKISYPLLVGEQDALDLVAALGVEQPAFPFTVFTDRRGQIVALYMGELKRAAADSILSVVAQLNADRIALPAARIRISEQIAALREKT